MALGEPVASSRDRRQLGDERSFVQVGQARFHRDREAPCIFIIRRRKFEHRRVGRPRQHRWSADGQHPRRRRACEQFVNRSRLPSARNFDARQALQRLAIGDQPSIRTARRNRRRVFNKALAQRRAENDRRRANSPSISSCEAISTQVCRGISSTSPLPSSARFDPDLGDPFAGGTLERASRSSKPCVAVLFWR